MIQKVKNVIKEINKNIFFYTLIYAGVILSIAFILNIIGYVFLNWFVYFNIILIAIGILIGTIKTVNESIEKKIIKMINNFIIVTIVIFVVGAICFGYALFNDYEEITYKDNKIMVKKIHSFLYSNWVNYYDYNGIFIRKKQVRIYEAHDDYIGDYLYTYYYDDNGKVIKTEYNNNRA